MPTIILRTHIRADIQQCFDTSRSIDVHVGSMRKSKEQAIAGRTAGFIQLHETVTWKARHFWIWWKMTVRITQMEEPVSFTDEMVRGPFNKMRHKHLFISNGEQTEMIDEFTFASPLGWLGKVADKLFVAPYMRQLLTERNQWLKTHAEQLGGFHCYDH